MFSSHERLQRKTPEGGINRREFIKHLVEEYHTTTNIEAQEQVTANLANFAYDPINWSYLKESETLQLFVELLQQPNERLQQHGLAGLCNICLDQEAFEFITHRENFSYILNVFLKTEDTPITLYGITLLYQLLKSCENVGAELKQLLAAPNILKKIAQIRQNSDDQRLINIATVFLEDFGSRSETEILQA